MEAELASLQNEPLLPISKDYWIPAPTEIAMLAAEVDKVRRGYLERHMLTQWATAHDN